MLFADSTPPLPATILGLSKGTYHVQHRSAVTKADFATGAIDVSTLAPQSVDVGLCPTVDFWGACDTLGSSITFAFVLFDEASNVIGVTEPHSLMAGSYRVGASLYAGDNPSSIDVGSARRVAVVILAVTNGTWDLYWRPYGLWKFPS